jgi:hypothetical protein
MRKSRRLDARREPEKLFHAWFLLELRADGLQDVALRA